MEDIKLFHLHFYCNDLELYESFFKDKMGFRIIGRFTVKGEVLDESLSWSSIKEEKIRLRLIELQKGAVNIVIMPGKFELPKLEHFGFLLSPPLFDQTISKANELGLTIRERPNRTFISSGQGFRLEIHKNTDNQKVTPSDYDILSIRDLTFSVESKKEFLGLLHELFSVEVGVDEILIGDSKIFIEEGEFSLKTFSLYGDKNLDEMSSDDIPQGFQLQL